MCLYRFTGNPFVDAGIAGMCAAAEVDRPEDLSYENVRSATQRLVGIFTSPQALKCGVGPGNSKASAFATSEMSVFFRTGHLRTLLTILLIRNVKNTLARSKNCWANLIKLVHLR